MSLGVSLQSWPRRGRLPPGQSPALAIPPIVDLPVYTQYNAFADLVEIIPGSVMDRPYNPPAVEAPNDLPDLGSRSLNGQNAQQRYDALAASDSAATLQLTAQGDYHRIILRSRPSGPAAGRISVVSNMRHMLPAPTDGRTTGSVADRVNPSHAQYMYRLRQDTVSNHPLMQQQGVSGVAQVVIDGADIAPDGGFFVNHMINLHPGSGFATDSTLYATDVELRRVWVHGITTLASNGVQVACRFEIGRGKVLDSYFSNIASDGESKCLLTIANPLGGFSVQNCFLQSLGESWFIGGGDPYIDGAPLVPKDIFFDVIHSHRPYEWNSKHPLFVPGTVSNDNKNGGEIKHGDRFTLQRYIAQNCWCCGQSGVAIVIKLENQLPPSGPNDVSTIYSRNFLVRHFLFFDVNRALGMAGHVRPDSEYVDIEVSRPTNVDIHNGVMVLGNAVDYDVGKNVNHVMINFGNYFKDTRLKRLTCLSRDVAYTPFLFGGNQGSDNVLFEDNLMQGGNFSGSAASSYKRTGTQTPVLSNDGDDIINLNTRNSTWRRNGIFQPPGTGTYTAAQLTSIQNRHILKLNTPVTDVINSFDGADPPNSDFTVKHPDFIAAGENGTPLGADWPTLQQHLAGVAS